MRISNLKTVFLAAAVGTAAMASPSLAQFRGGVRSCYTGGYGNYSASASASVRYGGYGYSGYTATNYSTRYNSSSPYFGGYGATATQTATTVSVYNSRYYSASSYYTTSATTSLYSPYGYGYGYYTPAYLAAHYPYAAAYGAFGYGAATLGVAPLYVTNPYLGGGYVADVSASAVSPAASIGPQKVNTASPANDTSPSVLGNWLSQQKLETQDDPKAKPITEGDIISGDAINALIDKLIDAEHRGILNAKGDLVNTAALNYHTVQAVGQYGFLALNGNAIPWGDSLADATDETKVLKDKIDADFRALAERNRSRQATAEAAKALRKDVSALSDQVAAQIRDLGIGKYTEAKRELKGLDATLQFLIETPDYQEWKRGLKADDVQTMVKLFDEAKLRVAPALPGEENAYRAAYDVLKKVVDRAATTAKAE